MRRKSILLCAAYTFLGLSAVISTAAAQNLKSTFIAGGFTKALYVTSEPTDSSRLYVVQQGGIIKLIKNGVTQATPYLNLTSIVFSSGNEQGLLGLAFHPNYASNGKFYVDYVDLTQQEVIREYKVSANPDVADPASFTTIFGPQIDPQSNHNGGNLQFGPDGYLYYGLGDGGNGNDTGPGHDAATGNAQSLNTYMGKMLRIDVNNPPTYVPASNPFAASAFPLIWAYGLRNPWRWSFDRLTGDMYIADVGQNAWEEIDFQPGTSTGGENYGWRCMEATHCTGFSGCTCNVNVVQPIYEYGHTGGACSITGGYVYRGAGYPDLQGTYIFGDYCNGKMYSFKYVGGVVTNFTDRTAQLAPGGGHAIQNPDSFGQDADGELYIVDQNGGEVYKLGEQCPTPTTYCQSAPNSAGPGGAMISFSGDGTISNNNLHLVVSGCPSTINGLFFYGQGQQLGTLGNGFLCIQNNLHRLPVVQTGIFGDADFAFDVTAPPAVITAGSTWNFQYWYRDSAAGGANFNGSNGLSVVFCP